MNRALAFVALLLASFASSVDRAAGDVAGTDVKRAIAAGARALKRVQRPDGAWPEQYVPGGETCLATLALLTAGEPPDSPAIAAALERIQAIPNERVYVVSLKLMVLAQADARRFEREIQDGARWLAAAQQTGGLWSYTQQRRPFDHSNTQFALLGLHAAAEAGVRVPGGVWQRVRTGVLNTQNRDGGWSYRTADASYGSMTAANVSNLLILGERIRAAQERGFESGAAPNCGKYALSRPLESGVRWLARNFRADANPERGQSWVYYWLYAVERAGILSGQRYFGAHDWYREGAEFLVRRQEPSGLWSNSLVETSFALLFLAKGHKPLLVQKLRWSEDARWNPDRHDLENLVAFIGDKLGEPVSWQVIDFDAPLEEWLAAPLLYMQGHEFPSWSAEQQAKLRAFVEQGGTLLTEACCGSLEFRAGFERLARETWPDYPLRELDAEHPVYAAFSASKPYGLMGIDVGCRTSILFSPRDFSCLWEQAKLPALSEQALELGTNIAAFATGRRPLRDRLDVITLPEDEKADRLPPADGALRLAQLVYRGDWRPDPHALENLAEALRETAGVRVLDRYQPVRAVEEELRPAPVVFMTGHHRFELSTEEQGALAAHLRRGGFLFAEACCGSAAFDVAFRQLAATLFPGQELLRLPAEHAVFRGRPGFDVSRVSYKPAVEAERPGAREPELWGIELNGRLVLAYSPVGVGCGLDGHVCHGCRGLVDEDARRLAVNVVLYALTH
ncbi:MAG: DUF4159 domain-containing protein [Phycisphaerae bacterium]